jgi:TRAP-type C4-dicarboxylate transport system permease small subunit
MAALLVGLLFILFAVYSVLPVAWGLEWWPYVLDFLKGSVPVIVLFIGIIAVLIGIADIRDRIEEKKEEEEEKQNEEESSESAE